MLRASRLLFVRSALYALPLKMLDDDFVALRLRGRRGRGSVERRSLARVAARDLHRSRRSDVVAVRPISRASLLLSYVVAAVASRCCDLVGLPCYRVVAIELIDAASAGANGPTLKFAQLMLRLYNPWQRRLQLRPPHHNLCLQHRPAGCRRHFGWRHRGRSGLKHVVVFLGLT